MGTDSRSSAPRLPVGALIGIGLLVGTVLGLVLGGLGLWIALGTIAGSIAEGWQRPRRRHGDRRP